MLAFGASLLMGQGVHAAPIVMDLVAAESWVQIGAGSEVSLELPSPFGTRVLAVESQVDGSATAGLRTNLEGTLLADIGGGQIQVLPQLSLISPVDSGLWLPGVPGDTGTPVSADLAIAFSDSELGIDGSAAFRESIFNLMFPATTLVDQGGGVQSFAPTFVNYQFATGLLDYDLGLEGASGRTALDTLLPVSQHGVVGTYEDLGGGVMRVTLPFAFDLRVYDYDLRSPVPTTVTIGLSGQIVALVIPEPSTALLLGVGCAGLAISGRRRTRLAGKEAE